MAEPCRPRQGGAAPQLARRDSAGTAAGEPAGTPAAGGEPDLLPGPELLSRREDGAELTMAAWRLRVPLLALSSAPHGGGWGVRHWVLAAQVAGDYSRRDPDRHLAALARGLTLGGPGIGMLTAVDVREVRTAREDGVTVAATSGVTRPCWAAARETGEAAGFAGTVNIVATVRQRLSRAALVGAVMTVTEAKSQALWDSGVPGTGTASDAVAVLCPQAGPEEPFCGPRSRWGARLALAAHAAVLDGILSRGGR
jgi:adenosylcobinamide amidohydrolase